MFSFIQVSILILYAISLSLFFIRREFSGTIIDKISSKYYLIAALLFALGFIYVSGK